MTSHGPNLCISCVHYRGRHYGQNGTCDAFPAGIPTDIEFQGTDHREPREGDNGIVYETRPGREGAFLVWESTRRA